MKLAELVIENYRGIGEAIRIKIDDIVVLIGNNNVGKTTVLSAYEAFASMGGKLTIKDFYQESINNTPTITGIFENVNKDEIAEKWIHKDDILGYDHCIKAQYRWHSPGESGQKYSYDPEKDIYEKGGLGGIDSILANRIPTPLKISPLDDPAELEKKILSILTEAIKENTKKDDSRLNQLLEQIEELANDVKGEIEEDIRTSTELIANDLKKIFPDFDNVEIDAKSADISPEKLINSGSFIRIGKNGNHPNYHNTPLSHHGTGLQRTFLWSCLKMLADTGREKKGKKPIDSSKAKVLLIEEPEAFLHPMAIKEAREALYAIADLDNWQVMTTTHSPIFIDLTKDHTTIIRLEKNNRTNHIIKNISTDEVSFTEDDKENLKMLNLCNPYFNEFFFANNNILVEGETEYTVLKSLSEQKKIKQPIHILNCFGKGNIGTVAKILNHFSVPYSIIHDSDNPTNIREGKKIKNSAWTYNKKIIEEVSNGRQAGIEIKTFLSVPDFEREFMQGIKGSSKPYEAWKHFKSDDSEIENFLSVIKYLHNETDGCKYEYNSIEDINQRVQDYIDFHNLHNDEYWDMSIVKTKNKV